jgi:hypothetical protein
MRPIRTPPLRTTAASKLRSWADRLDSRRPERRRPPAAPLVRLGGLWWQRDELGGERDV